jgi:hypothetical protein
LLPKPIHTEGCRKALGLRLQGAHCAFLIHVVKIGYKQGYADLQRLGRRFLGKPLAKVFEVRDWVSAVRELGASPQRDAVVGVSITLAAWLLGISRSRVHQLLKTRKLTAVDVYNDRRTRIAHMVTFASIARRHRTVKPRRTQWRSARIAS